MNSVVDKPVMSDLQVRIETDFAELDSLQPAWDDAVAELGGTVYMSYHWCKTWWECYGAGKQLRIFLFSSGERIVAIIPVYVDEIGFGLLRLRVARLLGANIPPKVFDPGIREEGAERVFERLLSHLFECDL